MFTIGEHEKVPPSDSGVYRVQVVSHGLFGRSQDASYDVRLVLQHLIFLVLR